VKIRFWGTRGSLPVALTADAVRAKVLAALTGAIGKGLDTPDKVRAYVDGTLGLQAAGTFGGHSPCVQLLPGGDDYLLCDLGSGARPFSVQALAQRAGRPATYHVLVSHVHWDHIMGFPFFAPIYVAGNRVRVYGCHDALEDALRRQQDSPSFPVPLSSLTADIEFIKLEPGQVYDIAGCKVKAKKQAHSGDSYGYRIERDGKSVVYSTDAEHKPEHYEEAQAFVEFFQGADLVIFDAMYSLADVMSLKEDWGHSSNVIGVELCQRAKARKLCLFHHEPAFDDATLWKLFEETRRLERITRRDHPVEILTAYDGLELSL
jgi:phosphoribosyl 1,2-cyclic phosphodiesterase